MCRLSLCLLFVCALTLTHSRDPPETLSPLDLSQRFYYSSENPPQLLLPFANRPPKLVLDRIKQYSSRIEWKDLPGKLQRALLYDTGFARDIHTDLLLQIYTKCQSQTTGISMHQVQITRGVYDAKCQDPEASNTKCPGKIARDQACNGQRLLSAVKCAITPTTSALFSSKWVDLQDPTTAVKGMQMPRPRIGVHEYDNWKIFSIHFQDDVNNNDCPASVQATEPVIPCTAYENQTQEIDAPKWCVPERDAFVEKWLQEEIHQLSSPSSSKWQTPVFLSLGIGLGLCFCIGCFVYRHRSSPKCTRLSFSSASPSEIDRIELREKQSYEKHSTAEFHPVLLTSELQALNLSGTELIPSSQVKVLRACGAGSFGEVLVAEYAGVLVALKKLYDADALDAFRREIHMLKSLHHPNIVQFIGITIQVNHLCSICEYLPKGDLYSVLKREGSDFPWVPTKARIAQDILNGLIYLHSFHTPILHRDLKSRNVLLAENYRAKLADFGLARQLAADTMTSTGSNLYVAPEISRGDKYTEKADIYSFGIVLTEIDTAKLPYHDLVDPDGNKVLPAAILFQVAIQGVRPTISATCPAPIQYLIKQCTQADPTTRPSAFEVKEYLQSKHLHLPRTSASAL